MTISHVPQSNDQVLGVQPVSSQEQLLHSISESLRAIVTPASQTPTLGFVQPPRPTWIYANRTQGDRWYWRIPTGEYELCPTAALSGRLVQLEFREVTRRQQPVWKLWATLEADRTYIIEAGKDSVFSKSLLASIATLQPTDLKNIVTIEVSPADQNQESLFCNLYLDGTKVYGKWGDNPDWKDITHTAMVLVNQAPPTFVPSAPSRSVPDVSPPEMAIAPTP